MGNVVMHNVVSVDGFIADEDDQVGPLFDWYTNGEHGLAEDRQDTTGQLKVSKASIDYVRPTWAAIGAMVIGRHLFDMTDGWAGRPPTGEHVVVVSHRPKPEGWHPEASYHFVDDVAAAVAKAKELAGEGTVAVAAGDVGGQALALGLGRRGGDGRGAGGLRLRQAVLRPGRRAAPARGPRCGHPRRPRAAPALPGSPLTGRSGADAVAAAPRVATPSLASTADTWRSTVRTDTTSRDHRRSRSRPADQRRVATSRSSDAQECWP
jgi:dihydrofolate reductase